MSYCVNCGVKLDEALVKCPLCDIIVVNPALIDPKLIAAAICGGTHTAETDTFPNKAGTVEEVIKRDIGLLISIILGGVAIAAFLLNLFVFRDYWWSLLIIGLCVILFFLALPAFILTKTPVYIRLLFNGATAGLYLFFISLFTPKSEWFLGLALPLLCLLTFIIIVLVWLIRFFKANLLTTALYIITAIAVLCIGIELLINRYLGNELMPLWSAVVLTACAVIDAGLITVLSRRRLRDDLRKRLHF
ncbi:MAG: DUF6320 domain-containing protein [Lachnospiraceae bacterium]|nr:DUF6320 domain-containing protein [Lachnospiraceae bacterium]